MKTVTIVLHIPDGVEVAVSQQSSVPAAVAASPVTYSQPVQNGPVCPKHGAAKVSPSKKGPGFYCTAHDDSGPRGYCTWAS